MLNHGFNLYQEEVHVPFMILSPDLGPRAIDTPVSTIGLLPTLADMLGLPPRASWQGRSLFGNASAVPVFSRTYGWILSAENIEMVRWGNMKLILDHGRQKEELYDLSRDPAELRNLVQEAPAQVTAMKAMLDAHHKENAQYPVVRGSGKPSAATDEDLKALGYL